MNSARKDIVTGALLCVLACAVYLAAPYTVEDFDDTVLTPLSFPLALSGAIAALSALLVLSGLRQRSTEQAPPDDAGKLTARSAWAIVAAIGAMIVYVAVLKLLGYMLSTAGALLALSLLYGNRSWPGMAVVAVLVPPAIFFFFERVMTILLPSSSLF